MSNWEKYYWTTLIHLEKPEHKQEIKKVAKKFKMSPSVLIGKLLTKVIESNTNE